MDSTSFRAAFPRKLRYWSLHCLINALPSLIIAAVWLELHEKPAAMAAMFAGIGSFILIYSTVTSAWRPLSEGTHVLSRSLKVGAKIRLWISLGSLPLLAQESTIAFAPDTWCGVGAAFAVGWLFNTSGARGMTLGGSEPSISGIYAITMVEGFILSFLLLMISFFSLVFLQARDRKKAFAAAR